MARAADDADGRDHAHLLHDVRVGGQRAGVLRQVPRPRADLTATSPPVMTGEPTAQGSTERSETTRAVQRAGVTTLVTTARDGPRHDGDRGCARHHSRHHARHHGSLDARQQRPSETPPVNWRGGWRFRSRRRGLGRGRHPRRTAGSNRAARPASTTANADAVALTGAVSEQPAEPPPCNASETVRLPREASPLSRQQGEGGSRSSTRLPSERACRAIRWPRPPKLGSRTCPAESRGATRSRAGSEPLSALSYRPPATRSATARALSAARQNPLAKLTAAATTPRTQSTPARHVTIDCHVSPYAADREERKWPTSGRHTVVSPIGRRGDSPLFYRVHGPVALPAGRSRAAISLLAVSRYRLPCSRPRCSTLRAPWPRRASPVPATLLTVPRPLRRKVLRRPRQWPRHSELAPLMSGGFQPSSQQAD
jgi:hypothetical protein